MYVWMTNVGFRFNTRPELLRSKYSTASYTHTTFSLCKSRTAPYTWEELFIMWGLCHKGKNNRTRCGIGWPTLNLDGVAGGKEAGWQEACPRTGNRSHPRAQLYIKANPQLLFFFFSWDITKLKSKWKSQWEKLHLERRKNAKLHYFSWILITLWTIGMSLPSTLKTTISPALIGSSWKFVKNKRSPLWKAGSMLPLQTRKEGDSLLAPWQTGEQPWKQSAFHSYR